MALDFVFVFLIQWVLKIPLCDKIGLKINKDSENQGTCVLIFSINIHTFMLTVISVVRYRILWRGKNGTR